MNGFFATRLLSVTIWVCLLLLVVIEGSQLRHRRTRANWCMFASSLFLVVGYSLLHLSLSITASRQIVNDDAHIIAISAKPIIVTNLVLSAGMLGGVLGQYLRLREAERAGPVE